MTGAAPADPRARTAHPFGRMASIVAIAATIAVLGVLLVPAWAEWRALI